MHAVKFAGQVATGGILVATGTRLNSIPLPGGQTFLPTTVQATVLTILIGVAAMNAVNFMEALAARCYAVRTGRPGRRSGRVG